MKLPLQGFFNCDYQFDPTSQTLDNLNRKALPPNKDRLSRNTVIASGLAYFFFTWFPRPSARVEPAISPKTVRLPRFLVRTRQSSGHWKTCPKKQCSQWPSSSKPFDSEITDRKKLSGRWPHQVKPSIVIPCKPC